MISTSIRRCSHLRRGKKLSHFNLISYLFSSVLEDGDSVVIRLIRTLSARSLACNGDYSLLG